MGQSLLSTLPTELRQQIYVLALGQYNSVVADHCSDRPPLGYQGTLRLTNTLCLFTAFQHPLALAQTCSQLRCEALETFLVMNTFTMTIGPSPQTGFPSEDTLEARVDQHVAKVDNLLDEILIRIGNDSKLKQVRLHLDLGSLPIRGLGFHRKNKNVACFLRKLQQLATRFVLETRLRPRIIVSITFEWRTAVRAHDTGMHVNEQKIKVHIDVGNGRQSLQEAIERVTIAECGSGGGHEAADDRKDNEIASYKTGHPSNYSNELSKISVPAQRAIRTMQMWQEQLVPQQF